MNRIALLYNNKNSWHLVAAKFSELSVAQWQWWSIVVDHFAHHFVAWTLFVDIVASQVAHQFDLTMRNFNRLLEHHPDDRLGEWWRGQWAQICPECRVFWQQFSRITAISEGDLKHCEKCLFRYFPVCELFWNKILWKFELTRSPLCVMNGNRCVILWNSSWCSPICGMKLGYRSDDMIHCLNNIRQLLPSRKHPTRPNHRDAWQPPRMLDTWWCSNAPNAVHPNTTNHRQCARNPCHPNNPSGNGIAPIGRHRASMGHRSAQNRCRSHRRASNSPDWPSSLCSLAHTSSAVALSMCCRV